MEDSQRKKYIKELQKLERKYQSLWHSTNKVKNSEMRDLMWDMESATRILIRDLEGTQKPITEAQVQSAIKAIQKYEPKIQAQLVVEKELDTLASQVDQMWHTYNGMKEDISGDIDPGVIADFHEAGAPLQALARSIADRSVRTPKKIMKNLADFNAALKAMQKAMK